MCIRDRYQRRVRGCGGLRMADDELVMKVGPGDVKKGGYAMIRGMPCKLFEVEQVKLSTAGGNKKLRLFGYHVFSGKKYEDTINTTAGFHGIDVPVTSSSKYVLCDVDPESGFLTLMDDSGEMYEAAKLGGEAPDFDEVGQEVIRLFEEDDGEYSVTVLSIMNTEIAVEIKRNGD
eukprot:TRINITY_DN9943_c0_g1_i1.p1 TRINITY_DN9943_c0_g1~~TRINITY_DN9943_c0_g1_i1.p1  ORF type:complete len:175 (-),score=72.42 TRINITY_DN9943_c0_g1_i1:356-880(-)